MKYGSISITVRDTNNLPIQGASVQIPTISVTETTNSKGRTVIRKIPYDLYTVKISAQ